MFRKRPRRAIALALTALLIVSGAYLFLTPLSTQRTTVYIHLRQAHDLDAVCAQLDSAAAPRTLLGFRVLSYVLGLEPRLQAGRYALPPSASALQLVRTLRNHQQAPVRLTLNNLRTTGDLAARLAAMLASDSAAMDAHILFARLTSRRRRDARHAASYRAPRHVRGVLDDNSRRLFAEDA